MERKEEYLFLREEIMKNNSAAESYRNVMYTVTIALLTIAFSQKEPLLFLLPLCIILPAYKIIIDKLNNYVKRICANADTPVQHIRTKRALYKQKSHGK